MKMLRAIPALPVRDMERSVEFYRGKIGLELVHREGGFAILARDALAVFGRLIHFRRLG